MVLELAKRLGSAERLVFDAEMARMMHTSIDDVERLADDLQELSRLERGKVVLGNGPCNLASAVESARESIAPHVELVTNVPEPVEGPWDQRHLARAISEFALTTNRAGDGSGRVALTCEPGDRDVALAFVSGAATGRPASTAPDAGFSFYRSRQFVVAMGGAVDYSRGDHSATIRVVLPRRREYAL